MVLGVDQGVVSLDQALDQWADRLRDIFTEEPLHFYSSEDFDGDCLKSQVMDSVQGRYGPSVGQHCGRPIPRHSTSQTTERR